MQDQGACEGDVNWRVLDERAFGRAKSRAVRRMAGSLLPAWAVL